jgi:hypothetical protein
MLGVDVEKNRSSAYLVYVIPASPHVRANCSSKGRQSAFEIPGEVTAPIVNRPFMQTNSTNRRVSSSVHPEGRVGLLLRKAVMSPAVIDSKNEARSILSRYREER